MASSSTREDLASMERANMLIVEFGKFRTWTIPMGAMLISGIVPERGCEKVPQQGLQLLDPSKPATADQLRRAGKVVDDWIEYHRDDEDEASVAPTEMSPLDFILDCDDLYQGTPRSMKPEWLDHLVSLCVVPSKSGPPVPGPIEVTRSALAWEQTAAGGGAAFQPLSPEPAGTVRKESPRKRTESFMDITNRLIDLDAIRAPYARAVAMVQDNATAPFDVTEVLGLLLMLTADDRWKHHVRMAEGKSAAANEIDWTGLEVSTSKQKWKPLKRKTLEQYLRRLKVKMKK